MTNIRPSPIAGTWYESNSKKLTAQIDSYLNSAHLPELDGEVIAVIAPHAGHRYSGEVAAHAFKMLEGMNPDLVVILSPYHNFSPHALLVTAHEAYSTPLGEIVVDHDSLAELESSLEIPITTITKDKEHSLEIELPFLQRVLKNNFKLLPIMLRTQEPEIAQKLGDALAKLLKNKNAVIVASTDLSHFYDSKAANILDQEMLRRFESLDPDSIFRAEQTAKGFACGHAAVASMFWAARALGADQVKILKYATSGDVTGDHTSVVGYGAAVVLKKI